MLRNRRRSVPVATLAASSGACSPVQKCSIFASASCCDECLPTVASLMDAAEPIIHAIPQPTRSQATINKKISIFTLNSYRSSRPNRSAQLSCDGFEPTDRGRGIQQDYSNDIHSLAESGVRCCKIRNPIQVISIIAFAAASARRPDTTQSACCCQPTSRAGQRHVVIPARA